MLKNSLIEQILCERYYKNNNLPCNCKFVTEEDKKEETPKEEEKEKSKIETK